MYKMIHPLYATRAQRGGEDHRPARIEDIFSPASRALGSAHALNSRSFLSSSALAAFSTASLGVVASPKTILETAFSVIPGVIFSALVRSWITVEVFLTNSGPPFTTDL